MGMYVGGEIAELAADRAAADRRGHRGPAGAPVADRLARGDRGGQGRAARGAARATARRSSTPTTRSSARMAARTVARAVTYGFADDADVGAEAVDVGRARRHALHAAHATACDGRVAIPTLGRLSVHNALAAAAVGRAAGLTLDEIATRPGGRLVRAAPGPARPARARSTVVDDTLQRVAARRSSRRSTCSPACPAGVSRSSARCSSSARRPTRATATVGEAAARTVDWLVVVGARCGRHRRGRRRRPGSTARA